MASEFWHDRDISAGTEWEKEISEHLNTAQIILLLISSDFMDSEYCYSVEMQRAMERHNQGTARVIPLILRPALWSETLLRKFQVHPKNAKAVTLWKNRDAAYVDIAQAIQKVMEEFQNIQVKGSSLLTQSHNLVKEIASDQFVEQLPSSQSREIQLPIDKNLNRLGRILVVDDLESWRNELVETLKMSGFHVDSVSSANEARARLDEVFYHLLITDIRQNESSLVNRDGLLLLRTLKRQNLDQAIKVIINSTSITPENMREAFQDYHVADFLSKSDFNHTALLQAVQQVFTQEMNINLALDVHWEEITGSREAVLGLIVNGIMVHRGTALQSQLATELDDLLCRLFNQAKGILVRPLSQEHKGKGLLLVNPFFSDGRSGYQVIVKFGNFREVEEEYNNFKEYVQPFIGGERCTSVVAFRRTWHLGGIGYSLLGASTEHLIGFVDFYRDADISQINKVLTQLFLDICPNWNLDRGQLKPLDLTVDYRQLFEYTPEVLGKVVSEELKSVQGNTELYFNTLKNKRTFTNPLLTTAGRTFVRATYSCITHGSLNQHNILIDNRKNVFLIGFMETGKSHFLRDVAMLDSMLRFQLLTAEEATLEERFQMEKALLRIKKISQEATLITNNKSLAKCYAIVVNLRTMVFKFDARFDELSEYYIALLYQEII